MLKKVYNIFSFLFYFLVSCIKLLIDSIFAMWRVNDTIADGSIWFAIFYQPLLVIIVAALFARKIDLIIYDFINNNGNVLEAIFLIFIIFTLFLFINAIIELLYRLLSKHGNFKNFFSIQKYSNNYMMSIISLIAIYAAINSSQATEINTMLLTCGILIFICIIITDLYEILFLSQNIVEDIYNNLQHNYKFHKK